MNNMINTSKEHLVDFRVFAKNIEEKVKAANVRKDWKKNMIMYYGSDWRKHNNYPFTLKDI